MSLPLVTGVAPRWETHVATLVGTSQEVHLVRRCADVAELVGVVAAGLARVVVVSADFRGLDRATLDAVTEAGSAVLALHVPGDESSARTLRRWGVRVVRAADLDATGLDEAIAELTDPDRVSGLDADARTGPEDRDASPEGWVGDDAPEGWAGDADPQDPVMGAPTGTTTTILPETGGQLDEELRRLVAEEGDPARAGAQVRARDAVDGPAGEDPARPPEQDGPLPQEPGEVIVVWGAYGSPGRTSVAVNVAAELATPLEPVLLVDADTYGASVAQALAVLDEAPGVAAACRAADQGVLDAGTLAALAPEVRPGLRVLTGLPRADRWPEIRDAALADVLEQGRQLARWVVVDVAPVLEQDEELAFDTSAPRRNGAALTALGAADRVLAVGSGDPLGLQRLVRALDALAEHARAPRVVVVTRVRPGPVGPEPGRRIREALARFAGAGDVRLVPEDREGLDAALLHGRALVEVRPGSPARQALRSLADDLAGRAARRDARRRRPRWRRPAAAG